MLYNHRIQPWFDNYISDTLNISNGITQGCPLSMPLYAFYNANLVYVDKGRNELSTGYIDDCWAFIAIGNTMDKAHCILKDMMECKNGGLEWLHNHNSQFELSKLAVMNFPTQMPSPPAQPPSSLPLFTQTAPLPTMLSPPSKPTNA